MDLRGIKIKHKIDRDGNVENLKISIAILKETKKFPNSKLPVLHYQEVLDCNDKTAVDQIKNTFSENDWCRPWVDGIYDFSHYHSNNHEVLGIAKGRCLVVLGGEDGIRFDLKQGDILIIPAGVAHQRIKCTKDFTCVGAYSIDVAYNMKYGKISEKMPAKNKMITLPLPKTDPIFGKAGPLLNFWKN